MNQYVGTGTEYCFRDNRPIGHLDEGEVGYTNIVPNIIIKYPSGSKANHNILCSGHGYDDAILDFPESYGYSSHTPPDSGFRMPNDVKPLPSYTDWSANEPYWSDYGPYAGSRIPSAFDADTYIYFTYPSPTAQANELPWLDLTNYGESSGPQPEIMRAYLPDQRNIDLAFNMGSYSAIRNVYMPSLTSMKSSFYGGNEPPYIYYTYGVKEVENVKFGNFSSWGCNTISTAPNASANYDLGWNLTSVKNVDNFNNVGDLGISADLPRKFEDISSTHQNSTNFGTYFMSGTKQVQALWFYSVGGMFHIDFYNSYTGAPIGSSAFTSRSTIDGNCKFFDDTGIFYFNAPLFYNIDFGQNKQTHVSVDVSKNKTLSGLPKGEYLPTDTRLSSMFSGCTFSNQTHIYLV